jgi:Tfp pilus assembly protein PilV
MTQIRSQAGISLVEVLFSISLFSVVAVGLNASTVVNMQLNTRGKTIAAATALAQNKLEQIRMIIPVTNTVPADLTTGTHQDPGNPMTALDGGTGTFTRTWNVAGVPQYYNGSVVGVRPALVRVAVTVTWSTPIPGTVTVVSYTCSTPNCG